MDLLIKYSLIIVFILFLLIYHILKHRNLSKRLKKLRANWGKLSEKKLDMESAKFNFNSTMTTLLKKVTVWMKTHGMIWISLNCLRS